LLGGATGLRPGKLRCWILHLHFVSFDLCPTNPGETGLNQEGQSPGTSILRP
jgi:hypothetical protein